MQFRLNLLVCAVVVGVVSLGVGYWLGALVGVMAVAWLAPQVHRDRAVWDTWEHVQAVTVADDLQRAKLRSLAERRAAAARADELPRRRAA